MIKTINKFKQLEKIVVSTGVGKLSTQPSFSDKILPEVIKEFSAIVGQKPSERPAKESISGFKLRAGTVVGLKATLRRARMQKFMEKVMRVVLPRVRDFRGIDARNIDKDGNLNFGIKDHVVFPEITPEHSKASFGLEVTVVPKIRKDHAEAVELYRELGVPFQKEESKNKK